MVWCKKVDANKKPEKMGSLLSSPQQPPAECCPPEAHPSQSAQGAGATAPPRGEYLELPYRSAPPDSPDEKSLRVFVAKPADASVPIRGAVRSATHHPIWPT